MGRSSSRGQSTLRRDSAISGIGNSIIINAVVLGVVLEADLGAHRKVGWFRLVRPLITAAIIVPFFLKGFSGHGAGLALELGGLATGVVIGLIAVSFLTVYRWPETGRLVSRAAWGYVAVWVVYVAARLLFTVGSTHWFPDALGSWLSQHHVNPDALTDALIFMAIATLLTRTAGLAAKARSVVEAEGVPVGQQPTL